VPAHGARATTSRSPLPCAVGGVGVAIGVIVITGGAGGAASSSSTGGPWRGSTIGIVEVTASSYDQQKACWMRPFWENKKS
jgi:hypothetical protein